MNQPVTVFVRRANAQSPMELVVSSDHTPYVLTLGQAVNLYRDLHQAIFAGSTISPADERLSGRSLAGDAPIYLTRTVNIPASANGQARASR